MDIMREWKREPLVVMSGCVNGFTLDDLVSDFLRRRTDPRSPLCKNRDDIVDYCAEAGTLDVAIHRAVASIRPNGKLHNHQSRVKKTARMELGRLLTRDLCDRQRVGRRVRTFEKLHDKVLSYEVVGIGPVTAYDVATRVGAWLGLEPRYVHLHAGCLQGLRALEAATRGPLAGVGVVGQRVDPALLPPALGKRLRPDEIEDFLCVYRNVLSKVWVEAGYHG